MSTGHSTSYRDTERSADAAERYRVLVIDDDAVDRMAVRRALRAAGIEADVTEASTCTEGLRALQAGAFDCAFVDHRMPDGDGFSLLREMRSRDLVTPVVVLTGHGDERLAVDLMKAGACDYVSKGVLSPDTLAHSLRRAVRLSRAEAETRRAQAALRDSEVRFRAMADCTPVLIWVSDAEGRCVFLNQGWLQFRGRTFKEECGSGWHAGVHPDDLPRVLAALDEASRSVRGFQLEMRLRRADGAYRWVLATGAPRFSTEGHLEGFVGSGVDITERREAEDALRSNQEEIQQLNEQLRRAMTETHHRVKNNLQVIAAMVDMETMDGAESVPADHVRQLGAHVHMLSMVHDILTEHAKEGGQASWLSAREVIEKLLPLLQRTALGRPVESHLDDANLSSRQGTSLALVLNELVSNAMKHGKGRIYIEFVVQGASADLVVSDDGPGFPPEGATAASANTGLDLVDNLARWDLGGGLRLENRPAGGARATVTIALLPAGPPIRSQSGPGPARGSRRRS